MCQTPYLFYSLPLQKKTLFFFFTKTVIIVDPWNALTRSTYVWQLRLKLFEQRPSDAGKIGRRYITTSSTGNRCRQADFRHAAVIQYMKRTHLGHEWNPEELFFGGKRIIRQKKRTKRQTADVLKKENEIPHKKKFCPKKRTENNGHRRRGGKNKQKVALNRLGTGVGRYETPVKRIKH